MKTGLKPPPTVIKLHICPAVGIRKFLLSIKTGNTKIHYDPEFLKMKLFKSYS